MTVFPVALPQHGNDLCLFFRLKCLEEDITTSESSVSIHTKNLFQCKVSNRTYLVACFDKKSLVGITLAFGMNVCISGIYLFQSKENSLALLNV